MIKDAIERLLFASRFLLTPLYLALAFSLLALLAKTGLHLYQFIVQLPYPQRRRGSAVGTGARRHDAHGFPRRNRLYLGLYEFRRAGRRCGKTTGGRIGSPKSTSAN